MGGTLTVGWPKGKPRKNHVNKDGSKHASYGTRVQIVVQEKPKYKAIKTEPVEGHIAKADLPLIGMSTRPIIEPCTKCGWAYSDGGYCENPNTNCNRTTNKPMLHAPNTVKSRLAYGRSK